MNAKYGVSRYRLYHFLSQTMALSGTYYGTLDYLTFIVINEYCFSQTPHSFFAKCLNDRCLRRFIPHWIPHLDLTRYNLEPH